MVKLTSQDAHSIALKLTTTAIENDLFIKHNTSSKTAEEVYNFYKTLYTKLLDTTEK